MSQQKNFLSGSIFKLIITFAFPILCGRLLQDLYVSVDSLVVSMVEGKQALAAVGGTTGTILNLLVGFVLGIASGASVIIAQYYGANKRESLSMAIKTSMSLSIVMGAVMMIIGLIIAPYLLNLMKTPDDVFDYALIYLRINFLGVIPSMIYNMGSGILRATGDTKRPLLFLVFACITNIVLDIILVVIFKFGVAGAAIATICSQIGCALLTLNALNKDEGVIHFHISEFSFNLANLKSIFVIGLTTGIQSTLYDFTNLLIQSSVNKFGTDALAGYTAYGLITSIFWATSAALGASCMTIAGQNYGAKIYKRVKETIMKGIVVHVGVTLVWSFLLIVFGKNLFHIFTQDSNVIFMGYKILVVVAPFYFTFSFLEIFSSCIRSCGKAFNTMAITAIGICGFRCVWLFFVDCNTIEELFVSYPLSWALTSIIFAIYYFSNKWLDTSKNGL